MWKSLRSPLLGLLTVLGIVASLFVVASPAQAYGSLTVRFALVNTGNCDRIAGTLTVITQSGGCRLNDAADNTFFRTDSGGTAVKVELRDSSGLVAKIEFHPYGEYFWIYDTRNDSDTIYAELFARGAVGTWDPAGVYSPPGTSAVVEYTLVNKSYAEGRQVAINIWDDSALTDFIDGSFVGVS